MIGSRSRPRTILAGLTLCALAACGDTPTEITPLPRAIGEVQGVLLQVDNLRPLDPSTQGIYYLWALLERNRAELMGSFQVDASGEIVDETGAPIDIFRNSEFSVRKTLRLLVTIEIPGPAPESPSGMQILSGTVIDGVANLTVPISTTITSASGSLRVFTPTDGPGTNETSGFWFIDLEGAPSLLLPDTTGALVYETFVELGGQTVPVGRFERADQEDDANQFSADVVEAPERPGEDLLVNAPEGLTFPADLSGARVTVSLEGRSNDFVSRSQLIILEATLPVGPSANQIVNLVNSARDTFPTGKAVLY